MALFCSLYLLILYHILCNNIYCQPIWKKAETTLPISLSKFVVGSYEDVIYLVGGVINEIPSTIPNSKIYALNVTNDACSYTIDINSTSEWQVFSEFPPEGLCCFDTNNRGALTMHSMGFAQFENALFIVPYVSEHLLKPTVLLIFDMERKSFRSPLNYEYLLAEPLGDPCVIATSLYVYLIGGVVFQQPSIITWKDTFQIYNRSNNSWNIGPKLVIKRRGAACNILGNTIYTFGGRGKDGHLKSIERYNLLNGIGWQILSTATLKKKDESLLSTVDKRNDLIYLFSGTGNTSLVQVFDKNEFIVRMFYLYDDNKQRLPQKTNFGVLSCNTDKDDNTTILLLGGSSIVNDPNWGTIIKPTNTIYSTSMNELSEYYFKTLKNTYNTTNSSTQIPTTNPTISPSNNPSVSPTINSSYPSLSPTKRPSNIPSHIPTLLPTFSPTLNPTISPTLSPTVSPTVSPTISPTISPTMQPMIYPTNSPSIYETFNDAMNPIHDQTEIPTTKPTGTPTDQPTNASNHPANILTDQASVSFILISIVALTCVISSICIGVYCRKKYTKQSNELTEFELEKEYKKKLSELAGFISHPELCSKDIELSSKNATSTAQSINPILSPVSQKYSHLDTTEHMADIHDINEMTHIGMISS